MKVKPLIVPISLLAICLAQESALNISLFNDKDLTQWSPRGKAEWRVEGGVIVGGQDGDAKRSGKLSTKQVFADFDLSLEFLIDEHGKYNSGVYFRDVAGAKGPCYQLNIGRGAAGEYVGLHREDWLDKGDEKDEIRKPKAWNRLRLRAVGAHIEAWLNGEQIVDYTQSDPTPADLAAGAISLQTYGAEGHAGWVKFRNIRIRDLSKKP